MNLLYDWLPARARLSVLRLGPLALVALPGEPVAAVGARLRAAAGEGAEVLSLAGDYLGYVETSEQMAEVAGETLLTQYGPELAERLVEAVKVAAQAVQEPPPAAGAVAAPRPPATAPAGPASVPAPRPRPGR